MKITIKVVPKASYRKVILDKNGSIKCYLNSLPEDGKANRELIKFLAEKLNIPQYEIEIMQGLTSKIKVLNISGFWNEEELYKALGLEIQKKFID